MTVGNDGTARPTPEWRESFRMNIATVDVEHRMLFALVKQLQVGSLRETLEELVEYVHTHFSREQQLMEASSYPDAEEHRRQHEHLTARVAEYHGLAVPWPAARVEVLRAFLSNWLESHILIHDLAFGRWYAEYQQRSRAARKRRGWLDSTFGKS